MSRAFSCLVTKSNKVYWKLGVDFHKELHNIYKERDRELDKDAPHIAFARIEIVPKNRDYLNPDGPDGWIYQIDEVVKPSWIKEEHKESALKAHKLWKEKTYARIALDQMPEHPFEIEAPKPTKEHLELLKEWISVSDFVANSVTYSTRDSVGNSISGFVWFVVRDILWDTIIDPVWKSVDDSGDSVDDAKWRLVANSLGNSMKAQIGPMFPAIKKYRHIHAEVFRTIEGYPFRSAVRLWRAGLVPCKDYHYNWCLIGSPGGDKKVEVLWRGTIEDLDKSIKEER